jgi:ADP-heptose:LPS heptosyltransferase
MGTPLLAALREAWPDAHLTWVVGGDARGAVEAHPLLDEILIWPTDYWTRRMRKGRPLLYPIWAFQARALRRAVRANAYDVFLSLQPEEWPHFVGVVAAPVSVGIFDTFLRHYGGRRDRRDRGRLYGHAFSHPDLHRVDQYAHALRALGLPDRPPAPMSLGYTADDEAAVGRLLEREGMAARDRLVVLAPMTTWPTKCWPSDRYAALGDALAARHGCRVALIGAEREREAVTHVAARMRTPPIQAAGTLTFRQMAALIGRAALLVSGDTGPMHVAAALGVPQVALFGATSPDWYGPHSGRALVMARPVPCGPCDQKTCRNAEEPLLCLRLLGVEEVLAGAEAMLGSGSGSDLRGRKAIR